MEAIQRFHHRFGRELGLHRLYRSQYQRLLSPGKRVSIITPTNKAVFMHNVFENFQSQAYVNKELIVVLNNNRLNYQEWLDYSRNFPDTRVYQLDESVTLGECLNYAVQQSTGDFIAKFDDDDYYGPHFLTDELICFLFTNARFVGKTAHLIYFKSLQELYADNRIPGYNYVKDVYGGTQVIQREVFGRVQFPPVNICEDLAFNELCIGNGISIYAADPFNYVRLRHNNSLHTWPITDLEFIQGHKLDFLAKTTNYKAFARV